MVVGYSVRWIPYLASDAPYLNLDSRELSGPAQVVVLCEGCETEMDGIVSLALRSSVSYLPS